jgi:hypothetical protein
MSVGSDGDKAGSLGFLLMAAIVVWQQKQPKRAQEQTPRRHGRLCREIVRFLFVSSISASGASLMLSFLAQALTVKE